MVKEIEKSILYVVHNIHFTANELAVINILYNAPSQGLTIEEIDARMVKTKQGKVFSGILSAFAQKIDKLENPEELYGFTGYLLFFERFNKNRHKIRPEFRKVINQHILLIGVFNTSLEKIYTTYKAGVRLK